MDNKTNNKQPQKGDSMNAAEAKKAAEMIKIIYSDNSVFYRNDKGNGCAGPCVINIESDDELEAVIADLTGDDARIVDFDEIVDDDGKTAKEFMQDAIKAHGDDAVIDSDDIIIEVSQNVGDNPYTAYYWVWSY